MVQKNGQSNPLVNSLTKQDIVSVGGEEILRDYDNSPSRLLSTVYPEIEWLPWKFSNSPQDYWDDVNYQRKYVDWLGKQLGVKTIDDWYNIKHTVFLDIIFCNFL